MVKKFSIEELDRMYDEAMAWEPNQKPPVDRAALLQKLLKKPTVPAQGQVQAEEAQQE
jgi:hypothetical protein